MIAKGAPIRNNVDRLVELIKKHQMPIAFGVDAFGSPEISKKARITKSLTPSEYYTQSK